MFSTNRIGPERHGQTLFRANTLPPVLTDSSHS